MLYRHCLLFIFFSLAAVLSYAEPVRVPDWAVNLGEGEYLGVSLPGGGQRQAEVMALMGMCQQRMLFCGSSAVFEDSVSYDVRKVGLLTSGETVVLISSGNSRTDYVRVTISHPFYTFPTYETSRFEADIQVEGECGMLVLASYSSNYYQGRPALVEHQWGKGKVLHFGGTFTRENIKDFLAYTGALSAFKDLAELPQDCELGVREKDGKQYLMVLNYSPEEQRIVLKVPVEDMDTEEKVQGQAVLKGYETKVYRCC